MLFFFNLKHSTTIRGESSTTRRQPLSSGRRSLATTTCRSRTRSQHGPSRKSKPTSGTASHSVTLTAGKNRLSLQRTRRCRTVLSLQGARSSTMLSVMFRSNWNPKLGLFGVYALALATVRALWDRSATSFSSAARKNALKTLANTREEKRQIHTAARYSRTTISEAGTHS